MRNTIAATKVPAIDRTVTASLGVALVPDDALTDKDLLRRADRALYDAKSNGRNRVQSAKQSTGAAPDSPPAPGLLPA